MKLLTRELPGRIREHLAERLRDRSITLEDLRKLQTWLQSAPDIPEGDWYKDFGSFKLAGRGSYPRTFLTKGQVAKGKSID